MVINELKDAAKTGGKNMTIFGVIAAILGMLAMLAPGLTRMSVIIMLGVLVLACGIVSDHLELPAGQSRQGAADVRQRELTLLCGIALIPNPLFASSVLTIMLTVYFILDGIFEIVAGM
jgi:uncharacterized membrane protein HdeD (DUF308 family)